MLTTLLEPTAGTALVAGYDIVREPAQVRRHIGYVPQLLSADAALTGRENLMLSARLYHVPRGDRSRRVEEALAFMEIADAGDLLVRTYSGGMIRRLELAQAMLHEPQLLFLDEPTIGLDPMARRAVWERLRDLKQRTGMTILLTTHDMEEAEALCDRLVILHQGRVAVAGTPSELAARLGPGATLEDAFVAAAGGGIEEGGTYRDVSQLRTSVSRRG
jgi:ABC-2 type transport system ATP-binding protein